MEDQSELRSWQRLNKSGSRKRLNGLIGSGAKRDDVFCLDKVRLNVNQIFAPDCRSGPSLSGSEENAHLCFSSRNKENWIFYVESSVVSKSLLQYL